MSLLDFVGEQRFVAVADRCFTVRRPTFGAVVLFEHLFAEEIRRLYVDCAAGKPISASPDLFADESDPRWARVLPLFVDGPGDPAAWPVAQLLEAACSMSDLRRIVASLRLGEVFGEQAAAPAYSSGQRGRSLMNFCKLTGTDRLRVMEWPYEAFLSACEELQESDETDGMSWYAGGIPGGVCVTPAEA